MSVWLSFHCFSGSRSRWSIWRSCSARPMASQNLKRMMPSRTSISSNSGSWMKKRSRSAGVHQPKTFSTTARLYQERSKRATSPAAGQVGHVALEVPLAALDVGGGRQCDGAGVAVVEVLGQCLDGAALAGGVAALEERTMRWPVERYQACALTSSSWQAS